MGALIAACDEPPKPAAGTEVGPAGGTVEGEGVTLSIPPGALDVAVRIQIAVSDSGAVEVPGRVRTSRVAVITPERLEFLIPVSVTLAYDPAKIPAGVATRLCDLRRTGISRAVERLSSIAVDESSAVVSGEALQLGAFFATAPVGRVATTVAITPRQIAVRQGQTAKFAAEVRDQDGAVMAGAPVVWSAANAKVASIDASGLAATVRAGSTVISARSGAAKGSATLEVAGTAPYPRSFGFESPLPGANDLFAIGGDATRLVAAGASGQIAELGSQGWTTLASRSGVAFHDLAVGPSQVTAVGASAGQGVVYAASGATSAWSEIPDTELLSVWMGAAGGAAVGAGPNLALFDPAASAWAVSSSPLSEDLLAVGGTEGAPVVVGARGSVYRRSQGAWVGLALTPLPQLQVKAVVRGEEAYAMSGSALLRFAQGGWSTVALPETGLALTALGASPESVALAGAGSDGVTSVLIGSGQEFQSFQFGREPVYALWGRSASDFWAAGRGGAVWHFDGSAWSQKSEGPTADVAALAVPDASRVFAAANACANPSCSEWKPSVLARGPDGRFRPMPGTLEGLLSGIAAEGETDLWAVGSGGAFQYRGTDWAPASVPGLPAVDLHDVQLCGGALYVAGASGLWSRRSDGAFEAVRGVWGNLRALACSEGALFAAGDFAIYRVAGGAGERLDPSADDLRQAVWSAAWASPDGELFVGGQARWILHFDGEHFHAFDRPGNLALAQVTSLWGSGFGDLWAAGELADGTSFLVHFDGTTWTSLDPGLERGLRVVRGRPGGDVWLGGQRGALLRGAPASQ
jgi:hypothetical protein